MRIIQEGILPNDIEIEQTCGKCNCIFAYKKADVKSDMRGEGDYIICPMPGCGSYESAKPLLDKIKQDMVGRRLAIKPRTPLMGVLLALMLFTSCDDVVYKHDKTCPVRKIQSLDYPSLRTYHGRTCYPLYDTVQSRLLPVPEGYGEQNYLYVILPAK